MNIAISQGLRIFLPAALTWMLGACGQSSPSTSELTQATSQGTYRAPSQCLRRDKRISSVIARLTDEQSWIAYSEGRGPAGHQAHTLAKHIGHGDEFLEQRLREERISAASEFLDQATAEAFVANLVATQSEQINAWLLDSRDSAKDQSTRKIALSSTCDGTCGMTLSRGDSDPHPETSAKAVLYRECLEDGVAFFILTAYPGASTDAS